jgi:hypothetical protein
MSNRKPQNTEGSHSIFLLAQCYRVAIPPFDIGHSTFCGSISEFLSLLGSLRLLGLKKGKYSAPPSAFNLQPAHLSFIHRGKMPLQHGKQVDRP